MSIRSYKDLDVWQKSIDLVAGCYHVTRRLPVEERFALSLQIRRAAVSVAANIAEGHARRSMREFLKHIAIARGSLAEVETLLEVVQRLRFATANDLSSSRQLADDVGRMLSRLRQSLTARPPRPASRAPRP